MSTLIEAIRSVLGIPPELEYFPDLLPYALFFEYAISGLLLLVVVASVFKIIINWAKN